MTIDSTTKVYLNGVEQVKIIKNGSVIWEKQQDNTDYFYIENTYPGQNTVTLTTTKTGSPTSGSYTTSVQWSKDKSNWTTITLTTSIARTFVLERGEKAYFRNDSGKWSNYASSNQNYFTTFTASNSHIVGGNANTLINYTDLNNVTLTEGCFFALFRYDTNITSANLLSLPSMTLARMCYNGMFYGCSNLTSIPTLPATTLEENCYQNMFRGTAITTPPVLPAATMTRSCYNSMFRDCASLTTAPVLNSTNLYEYCYASMFQGCTSLTTSPILPATTLTEYCYRDMFNGCTSLNSVTTYANNISANSCLSNWLSNVAASGTFYNNGSATYTLNSPSGIPTGWTEVKPNYFYIENTGSSSSTLVMTMNGTTAPSGTYATSLQYSSNNGSTWNTVLLSQLTIPSITIPAGGKLLFRNNSGKLSYYSQSGYRYLNFFPSSGVEVGGDLMTLVDYTGNTNTLESGAFYGLLSGNVTDASNLTLPSTISEYCYGSMFYSCSSLITGPELPATTLAYRCYANMFSGCTSLDSVTTYANDISATDCLYNWLDNVAANGTFYNFGSATYTVDSASGIPVGWTIGKNYLWLKNESSGINTISITNRMYDPHDDDPEIPALDMTKCGTTLQYSKDRTNWTTLTISPNSTNTITMNACEKVYFRNDSGKFNYVDLDTWGDWSNIITNSARTSVGGDVHTLVDYTGTSISSREVACLRRVFVTNSNLVDASNIVFPSISHVPYEYELFFASTGIVNGSDISLPVTTLNDYCYSSMFSGCTSLTTVPVLTATTLASGCYSQMFSGCTSLTTAPVLTATTLADGCYGGMFSDCTSLTSVPSNLLPATDLMACDGCYASMFQGCTNLTTTPSLPATTLANNCYANMFDGCSSLTTAPSLPATDLTDCYYCYNGMFYGCTSLTTAPELYPQTLVDGCYGSMFSGCSSLNEVTCYATDISAEDCTFEWLSNVADSGTLYTPDDTIYTTDDPSGIPTGWTASIIQ